jgi:hypothetical protein
MRGAMGSSEDRGLDWAAAGPGAVLALIGLATWVGVSFWAGHSGAEASFRLREAWDVSAYFYVGIPIMAAAVAVVAFLRPERAWRWPLWLVAGHQLGMLIVGVGMQSALSLTLLTIILAILLAAFFAVPAMVGAMAARAMAERAY